MASEYIRGTSVRKPQKTRRPQSDRVQQPQVQRRHRNMSLGYLIFLSLAMVLMVGTLAWYISLQSEIKNSVKNIAALESQLNNLKQDNDEAYNRANGNVDLDEVKRIAIQEYGMTYATEGQIVRYSDGGGNDYVRQLAPIPEADKN
jgi:cell division protein FtsL